MKRSWAIRRSDEAVSPVIATILLVAITVVLVAVLYVMVLGISGSHEIAPQAYYQPDNLPTGKQVTIISITKTDVIWDDIVVSVQAGTDFASWSPAGNDLKKVGGEPVSFNYSSDTLGNLTLSCTIYDNAGNGFVSGGDYLIFSAVGSPGFSDDVDYYMVLVYEPTGDRIGIPVKLPRN